MENKDYLFPGVAALLLAVIHPIYWLGVSPLVGDNNLLWQDISSLGLYDVLFASIVLLNIYIYLNLKNILNEQLNFNHIDLLVMVMVTINALWLSTLFLDVASVVLPDSLVTQNKNIFLNIYLSVGIGSIIIIGIVDLLIGILLLMKLNEAPTLLKIFAIMSVIQGVVGMTVFFAGILIFIIPVTFIILAMFFLRKPESIEIV
jgi:hypothetical protein|tara:strand:- start:61 stop:669 length:609 start_codon:yes stop_codon:yes gene_type:complete